MFDDSQIPTPEKIYSEFLKNEKSDLMVATIENMNEVYLSKLYDLYDNNADISQDIQEFGIVAIKLLLDKFNEDIEYINTLNKLKIEEKRRCTDYRR